MWSVTKDALVYTLQKIQPNETEIYERLKCLKILLMRLLTFIQFRSAWGVKPDKQKGINNYNILWSNIMWSALKLNSIQ